MLARLSLAALDIKFGAGGEGGGGLISSQPRGEELKMIDMDVLRWMPEFAWRRAVGVVEDNLKPMCKSIGSMLSEDAEHVAQVLYELESNGDVDDDETEVAQSSPVMTMTRSKSDRPPSSSSSERLRRKRRRSHSPTSQVDQPLIVQSNHPSIPTIVVTPCPSITEEGCRIPFQDSMFGDRLTVPIHPVYNKVHPPLLLQTACPPPVAGLGNWRWEGGHWRTVLPTVEEQAKKGLYSRPLTLRRRACRGVKEA